MAKTAGRPPRSESDIAEYRSKIAKQALAIYRAEGFDAVSMRRLAKEVGCAPMTIYAHFEGKHDILRYLWADVLADMSSEIQGKLERIDAPAERLQMAAQTFVSYWVDHPDHFRLVFAAIFFSSAVFMRWFQAAGVWMSVVFGILFSALGVLVAWDVLREFLSF